MPRIALVDDDATLLETLRLAFEAAGHEVQTAEQGAAALRMMQRVDIELLVSDVNMPEMDGFTLCRRLREGGSKIPIILLTSRDSEIDEVLGLDLGADDYMTKPFSTRVLLARVAALLRRTQQPAVPQSAESEVTEVLERGDLSLDLARLEASFQGQRLDVTVTEVRLLEALMRRPGHVLSRERLLAFARGGDDSVVAPRLADTYVARLRRKMKSIDPDAAIIETVVGAGYRLREL